ncbi:glycosyltransferase family 1 protein [Actibacterium sp. MT2.3-13A]|uniref:glycosyltransferase family 4 protein n=1 Tax=Actibacterium sp. MT2.3-13A TaxID=2828332 RepID=UPI001BA9E005|nr:glycosyltransferase family 1 protein [Actibacterium sp. MT2.3-13A]
MRLVVDGVFFQLNNTGIARVWETVLQLLAARAEWEIFLLDRGGAPRIEGITNVPFPAYKAGDVAADSLLIQKVCDHLEAEAFTSTYYTTPLSVPMVLMVYDMIPERFDFDMSLRGWMEKETSIAYAQRYLCISESTRRDLLHFYPEIPPDHARVAYCGVDTATFAERPAGEVAAFREAHGLDRPYFLFVGSRVQHKSYKNSDLFFSALKQMTAVDFDIFCVGGEKEIEPQVLDSLPEGVRAQRVVLSDHDLSLAYAGAAALVYPSLYEGFGMPVIEAMASGCPVITTRRGSLAEAAGDAALFVEGTSVPEMAEALTRVQDPAVQADLRARGLAHAARFRWEPMAELLAGQVETVIAAGKTPEAQAFFGEWARLRNIQANVDYL